MNPKTFWSTFQESDGTWSFGRVASAITVLSAVFCLIYLTLHNHQLPDTMQLAALGAFGVFPYGTNKAREAVGVFQKTP